MVRSPLPSFRDRDRICTCATTTVGHPLQRERVNYSATRSKVHRGKYSLYPEESSAPQALVPNLFFEARCCDFGNILTTTYGSYATSYAPHG